MFHVEHHARSTFESIKRSSGFRMFHVEHRLRASLTLFHGESLITCMFHVEHRHQVGPLLASRCSLDHLNVPRGTLHGVTYRALSARVGGLWVFLHSYPHSSRSFVTGLRAAAGCSTWNITSVFPLTLFHGESLITCMFHVEHASRCMTHFGLDGVLLTQVFHVEHRHQVGPLLAPRCSLSHPNVPRGTLHGVTFMALSARGDDLWVFLHSHPHSSRSLVTGLRVAAGCSTWNIVTGSPLILFQAGSWII